MGILPVLDTLHSEGWTRHDYWKLLEVSGLWLAATVGVAAIYVASGDSHEQLSELIQQVQAIGEQAKEAKTQRLMTVEQTRAHLRREPPEITEDFTEQTAGQKQVLGWLVSPKWINSGSTSAKETYSWYSVRIISDAQNIRDIHQIMCPEQVPAPRPEPLVVLPGAPMTMLPTEIYLSDIVAARNGQKLILFYGRLEYRDVYPDTTQHYDEWCVVFVPNDIEKLQASPIIVRERTDG